MPVEESVSVIHQLLVKDTSLHERTSLNPSQVSELLQLCLNTTYFLYNGDYYIQKEGAAMGSPVSPIVANLFMESFEESALSTFRDPPRLWGRYVDDTIVVINTDSVDDFTDHLNNTHQSIRFTVEKEIGGVIPLLDVKATRRDDGTLRLEVYRKKTHTEQYLQFTSHQPLENRYGVIRTITHRAKTITTEKEDLVTEMNHLKKVLSVSGYPKWAWSAPSSVKKVPHPNSTRSSKAKGHVTLP